MGAFDDLQAIPPQVLANGYFARVAHGKELTPAVVEIAPGAELSERRHVNAIRHGDRGFRDLPRGR